MAAPRIRVNPALLRVAKGSGIPLWKLTYLCGIPHTTTVAALLHNDTVRDTASNVERLYAIADAVGFPRAYVLLDESTAAQREQARAARKAAKEERRLYRLRHGSRPQAFSTMPVAPSEEDR